MAYSSIPSTDTDANSPITETLMTQIVDNIDDHTHVSGAGGTLGSSSVNQTALSTTTSEHTTSLASGARATYTATGGTFTLGFETKSTSSSSEHSGQAGIHSDAYQTNSSYATYYAIKNHDNVTASVYINERYIQASPPYNLGNGDISLFIFATIDNNTGEIVDISIAPDPPWANNGPTCTRPDLVINNIKYQRQIVLPSGLSMCKNSPGFNDVLKAKLSILSDRDEWLDALRNPQIINVEVTHEIKNADLDIIPFPFVGVKPSEKTVVLIDPTGNITDDLLLVHNMGGSVADIVRDYLIINNSSINGVIAPSGVMAVKARWK